MKHLLLSAVLWLGILSGCVSIQPHGVFLPEEVPANPGNVRFIGEESGFLEIVVWDTDSDESWTVLSDRPMFWDWASSGEFLVAHGGTSPLRGRDGSLSVGTFSDFRQTADHRAQYTGRVFSGACRCPGE